MSDLLQLLHDIEYRLKQVPILPNHQQVEQKLQEIKEILNFQDGLGYVGSQKFSYSVHKKK